METADLLRLSRKLKISPVEIIREYLELLILQEISQSSLGKKLIFKGGTALRLCYDSPRFSQDLDFNRKQRFSLIEFRKLLENLAKIESRLSVKDCYQKRFTVFGLLGVKDKTLKQTFSIKIEISLKQYRLTSKDYQLKACRSETSQFTPLVYVYTLERILKEKMMALATRAEPRDYFDAWWIGEKLGRSVNIPKPKIYPSRFKGEISQLLPLPLKNWARDWLKTL